jgi:tRNA threonylcarbamoyladenosine biosynthesis protein TsaB
MRLLALDTVTEMCSVALQIGEAVITREQIAARSHTELILPMVDAVLAEAGCTLQSLDALAVDRGPGSFTGLRIGIGVAQGLAFGADLPVLEISSLATLAQGIYQSRKQDQVLACIDARQAEVYWACFSQHNGLMHAVTAEQVTPANQLHTPANSLWYGVGTGFDAYSTELSQNPHVHLCGYVGQTYPLARDMLPLAQALWQNGVCCKPEDLAPVYIRNNVVTLK